MKEMLKENLKPCIVGYHPPSTFSLPAVISKKDSATSTSDDMKFEIDSNNVNQDQNNAAPHGNNTSTQIITYKGFKHDVISVPTEKLNLFPHGTVIVEKGPETSKIIACAWLDHVYSITTLECKAYVCPSTGASDHSIIYANVKF